MDNKGRNYDWNANSKRASNLANYNQSIGFDAGGNRYVCVCYIVSEHNDKITIDNNNINRFEWANEVNGLCLTGLAEICDMTGDVGRIFSKYFCHLCFEIRKCKDGPKRSEKEFNDISFSDAVFRHTFIVNNFEIIRRTRQFVMYRLYLIGTEWYGLISNYLFSNYHVSLPPENDVMDNISENMPDINGSKKSASEKTPTEIFSIIKQILGSAFTNSYIYKNDDAPKVDDASFKNIVSPVNLHVCFGYNFTMFDSIKFLLNKLYYNELKSGTVLHDLAPKFIVYDEFQNKYGVVKYGSNSDFIKASAEGTSFTGTWMSLFGSQFEALTEPIEQDLESVVKKSTVESIKTFFSRVYHYFTPTGFGKTQIKSDELVKYYDGDVGFPSVDYQKYAAKVMKEDMDNFFKSTDTNNYEVHGSQWSNDFTIYVDQVTNLINKDVLVLHTKGDITHRPGMHFAIIDDSELMNDISQDSKNAENTLNANKEIKGAFNVIKVRHIVKPNSKEKDNFMEKIFLSRNFVAE